ETHLFAPRDTPRVLPGIDWSGNLIGLTNYIGTRGGGFLATTDENGKVTRTFLDAGENPPAGVVVHYRLAETPSDPLTLTFKKANGDEIRSFTSRQPDDPAIAKELRAPADPGWNRFLWDMRYTPVTKIEGTDPPAEKPIDGPIVAPGDFTVTLKAGDTELTQPFKIVKPSNLPATQEDLDAQEDLLLRIYHELDRTTNAINRMRDLRAQLDGWSKRTKDRKGASDIAKDAENLRDKVLEIEKTILIPDTRSGWADSLNQGARLLEKLSGLTPAVALGDYRPTDAAEQAFTDITNRLNTQITAFDTLVADELPKFNELVQKSGLAAVVG
ncbi:MAG TPA: hypothetical protein VFL82_11745, partial [Thermomicrobiales bacterium]|nr:hypothetical protein [Thermomicrobiales bacterium]